MTMTTTTTKTIHNQQRVSSAEGQEGKWPQLSSERAACWDFVLSLREQFGLDEAGAIARAVELLERSGRVTTVEAVRGCRPLRKGPDSHVQDIGRAVKERGFVEAVDGREVVLGLAEEAESVEEGDAAELRERLRLQAGVEVLSALFRKVIPALPRAKWKAEARSLVLHEGDVVECVSGRRPWDGVCDLVASVLPENAGWMVRDEAGGLVAVVRGAVRILRAAGGVRVLLNATVKGVLQHGGFRQLVYFQWVPGAGDWEYSFKLFVTYGSMFAPGVTDHARASALASLFDETRAAMSARKVEILEEYRAAGGRAGFEGMRTGVDPRKGKRVGPRKKPVDASLN